MAPQRRDVPPGAAATKKAAVVCALGQWPRADGTSYGTKTQIAPTVGRSSPETASQALPQQARGTLDARLASTEAGCASSPVGENAATVEWFGLFPRLASRCCRGCRQASPRRRGQCPGEALRCVGAGAARPSAGATPRARGKGRRTPHNPTAKRARPFPARLGGRADGHRAAWARVALARRAWRRSGTHAPASAGLGALSLPACRRHRRLCGRLWLCLGAPAAPAAHCGGWLAPAGLDVVGVEAGWGCGRAEARTLAQAGGVGSQRAPRVYLAGSGRRAIGAPAALRWRAPWRGTLCVRLFWL